MSLRSKTILTAGLGAALATSIHMTEQPIKAEIPSPKEELSPLQKTQIMEYFRLEAWKKHKNRHNTPFDAQIRNKKRAKVKASRRANLDRILRDK